MGTYCRRSQQRRNLTDTNVWCFVDDRLILYAIEVLCNTLSAYITFPSLIFKSIIIFNRDHKACKQFSNIVAIYRSMNKAPKNTIINQHQYIITHTSFDFVSETSCNFTLA